MRVSMFLSNPKSIKSSKKNCETTLNFLTNMFCSSHILYLQSQDIRQCMRLLITCKAAHACGIACSSQFNHKTDLMEETKQLYSIPPLASRPVGLFLELSWALDMNRLIFLERPQFFF
jgi:hypothetical protein